MKFLQTFRSRTVWMIILLFVINGVAGIRTQIPTPWLSIIDAVLAFLAIHFRTHPKQEFNK